MGELLVTAIFLFAPVLVTLWLARKAGWGRIGKLITGISAAISAALFGVVLLAFVTPESAAVAWLEQQEMGRLLIVPLAVPALYFVGILVTNFMAGMFSLGGAASSEGVRRGTQIAEAGKRKKRNQDGSAIEIGGVEIPRQLEAQHFLFSGTTGTGKTQAINAMLRTIRTRGQRAIIADPGGGFYARFGRPGDVLLNPFDARTANWSIFSELKAPYDADRLARALIPDGVGDGAEWTHYAQGLTATILRAMHRYEDHSLEKLVWWLTAADAKELAMMLEGSPAAALTARGNERMLASTRGVLSSYLGVLPYLADDGDFSVRDWVRNVRGEDSWLFITYRDDQADMLRRLVATMLELAIVEGLSLSENQERGLWFVLDEVDSLGKVSSLRGGLTKLRKYGGRCILGLQTISQLRATYGRDEAQTLLANCSTKLILRAGDAETAKAMEDELGQQEIERHNQSESISKDSSSTSTSISISRESAVMASEIMAMQDLRGLLKMPGNTIHAVALDYVAMPEVNMPFEGP